MADQGGPHPAEELHGEVVLRIPARAEYARLARLAATGLATRAGFSYDEIEDIRIAVGEACALLIGDGDRDATSTIHLTYRVDGGVLHLRAETDGANAATEAPDLSTRILAALVRDLQIEPGAVTFSKSRADA